MLATPELLQERAQRDRLADKLALYLSGIPLYARTPLAEPTDPASAPARLISLPFIHKRHIRENFPHNFLRQDVNLQTLLDEERVELEHTSGTSEDRTPLLLAAGWWAEQERRALLLNPTLASTLEQFPNARRVTIVSPACSNDICFTGVPSRAERIVGDALFVALSRFPFLWSDTDLARMTAEAIDWNPRFLDVDPVYAVPFALYCERHGIRFPELRFIIASYEFVSVVHRRILERVFRVPVLNLYGSTETGHLLMQDNSGELRPSLETAFLEVVDLDERGIGSLIVTTLTNDFMPLVRYAIGDLVHPIVRPYGTRYELHGRAADAFRLPCGRRVTVADIDQCFAEVSGISHYQLAETAPRNFRLRFIPEIPGHPVGDLPALRARLANLLEAETHCEPATGLLAEASGKFRLTYPQLKAPQLPAAPELMRG